MIKGAIIGVDLFNPLASVVVFQYNPDTMTRKLEPRAVSSEGDRGEAFRLTGAPKETITLSVEIDATDQLEQANPLATTMGTCPKLAAPFSKDWHLLFKEQPDNQNYHPPIGGNL